MSEFTVSVKYQDYKLTIQYYRLGDDFFFISTKLKERPYAICSVGLEEEFTLEVLIATWKEYVDKGDPYLQILLEQDFGVEGFTGVYIP